MAFRLPTFNIACSIWRTGWAARNYSAPDVGSVCNLTPGKRVMQGRGGIVNGAVANNVMELLLPPLTDIRASYQANNSEDLVEVPSGSKRFYEVQYVDDIGKGFPNEHRFAIILFTGGIQTFADTGGIPVPVPLP